MPVSVVSLMGFMDLEGAINYLQGSTIPDKSEAACRHLWTGARGKLGQALKGAGRPDIQPLPPGYEQYVQGVMGNPRFLSTVDGLKWSVSLVEIDPLLAFQHHVETE